MEQKALLRVVIILLGLSYVLFAAAVPATRSIEFRKVDASVQGQDLLVEEDLDLKTVEEVLEFGTQDRIVEGRMMMINIADYPRTGSNPVHTPPKSPGKA